MPNTSNLLLFHSSIRALYGSRPPCRLLHLTTPVSKQNLLTRNQKTNPRTTAPSSRTRLAKDITPTKSRVPLQHSKPAFIRDTVPHEGAAPVGRGFASGGYEPSAFRRRRQEDLNSSSGKRSREKADEHGSSRVRRGQDHSHFRQTERPSKPAKMDMKKMIVQQPAVESEFVTPSNHQSDITSVTRFTSPPLLPGFISCLHDIIGPNSKPTPIQALSIRHFIERSSPLGDGWKQALLASETGSGKSIAYLLPVLQALKQSESTKQVSNPVETYSMNPRALILAPTHELSRQLSGFAKSLLHVEKLRVVCASRSNTATRVNRKTEKEDENKASTKVRDTDVVVGTPMKILEMLRGRGWDSDQGATPTEEKEYRKGRDANVSASVDRRKGFSPSELGLHNIEWVVIDEADILLDPDFVSTTELLLSDISAARRQPVPTPSPPTSNSVPQPLAYPFNLILTSATIPSALSSYLSTRHPDLVRLASPGVHHLPKNLKVEYSAWSGGNKFADVERKIRLVWEAEVYGKPGSKPKAAQPSTSTELSKVLVFCNKNTKVEELGEYLKEKGIKNIALTSTGDVRRKGSNHHLDGFLKSKPSSPSPSSSSSSDETRVLITTSLLSRGLDFSPEIKHVFIVDEPRNMVDFLHRAGRSGRAGKGGTVVLFGKTKGRGSSRWEGVKKKVGGVR